MDLKKIDPKNVPSKELLDAFDKSKNAPSGYNTFQLHGFTPEFVDRVRNEGLIYAYTRQLTYDNFEDAIRSIEMVLDRDKINGRNFDIYIDYRDFFRIQDEMAQRYSEFAHHVHEEFYENSIFINGIKVTLKRMMANSAPMILPETGNFEHSLIFQKNE